MFIVNSELTPGSDGWKNQLAKTNRAGPERANLFLSRANDSNEFVFFAILASFCLKSSTLSASEREHRRHETRKQIVI